MSVWAHVPNSSITFLKFQIPAVIIKGNKNGGTRVNACIINGRVLPPCLPLWGTSALYNADGLRLLKSWLTLWKEVSERTSYRSHRSLSWRAGVRPRGQTLSSPLGSTGFLTERGRPQCSLSTQSWSRHHANYVGSTVVA